MILPNPFFRILDVIETQIQPILYFRPIYYPRFSDPDPHLPGFGIRISPISNFRIRIHIAKTRIRTLSRSSNILFLSLLILRVPTVSQTCFYSRVQYSVVECKICSTYVDLRLQPVWHFALSAVCKIACEKACKLISVMYLNAYLPSLPLCSLSLSVHPTQNSAFCTSFLCAKLQILCINSLVLFGRGRQEKIGSIFGAERERVFCTR